MSACCLSVSLKLSEEIEVIEGAHWSRSDYEGWMGLTEMKWGRIAVGKMWKMRANPLTAEEKSDLFALKNRGLERRLAFIVRFSCVFPKNRAH